MKTFNLILFIGMLVVGPMFGQVKSDYDKDTDFSKYKTYKIAGWQDGSDKQLTDFDKQRILDAINSEFQARGMTPADDNPDASIVLYLVLDQKTSTTAYTNYTGGLGYGARWGWGMGAGMGSATTTYSENDYTEGTFVIDVYDSATKKLIWQGIDQTIVQEKPEKRDKTIPKNIGKLMKEYPIAPK